MSGASRVQCESDAYFFVEPTKTVVHHVASTGGRVMSWILTILYWCLALVALYFFISLVLKTYSYTLDIRVKNAAIDASKSLAGAGTIFQARSANACEVVDKSLCGPCSTVSLEVTTVLHEWVERITGLEGCKPFDDLLSSDELAIVNVVQDGVSIGDGVVGQPLTPPPECPIFHAPSNVFLLVIIVWLVGVLISRVIDLMRVRVIAGDGQDSESAARVYPIKRVCRDCSCGDVLRILWLVLIPIPIAGACDAVAPIHFSSCGKDGLNCEAGSKFSLPARLGHSVCLAPTSSDLAATTHGYIKITNEFQACVPEWVHCCFVGSAATVVIFHTIGITSGGSEKFCWNGGNEPYNQKGKGVLMVDPWEQCRVYRQKPTYDAHTTGSTLDKSDFDDLTAQFNTGLDYCGIPEDQVYRAIDVDASNAGDIHNDPAFCYARETRLYPSPCTPDPGPHWGGQLYRTSKCVHAGCFKFELFTSGRALVKTERHCSSGPGAVVEVAFAGHNFTFSPPPSQYYDQDSFFDGTYAKCLGAEAKCGWREIHHQLRPENGDPLVKSTVPFTDATFKDGCPKRRLYLDEEGLGLSNPGQDYLVRDNMGEFGDDPYLSLEYMYLPSDVGEPVEPERQKTMMRLVRKPDPLSSWTVSSTGSIDAIVGRVVPEMTVVRGLTGYCRSASKAAVIVIRARSRADPGETTLHTSSSLICPPTLLLTPEWNQYLVNCTAPMCGTMEAELWLGNDPSTGGDISGSLTEDEGLTEWMTRTATAVYHSVRATGHSSSRHDPFSSFGRWIEKTFNLPWGLSFPLSLLFFMFIGYQIVSWIMIRAGKQPPAYYLSAALRPQNKKVWAQR
jgi:hypothetical protein